MAVKSRSTRLRGQPMTAAGYARLRAAGVAPGASFALLEKEAPKGALSRLAFRNQAAGLRSRTRAPSFRESEG